MCERISTGDTAGLIQAPAPVRLIPGGLPTEALVAYEVERLQGRTRWWPGGSGSVLVALPSPLHDIAKTGNAPIA